MKKHNELLLCIVLSTILFAGEPMRTQVGAAFPDHRSLPRAPQVILKYVEAIGGHDSIFRHKSMTVHGKFEIPKQNAILDQTGYYKGGRMLYEVRLPNGSKYQEGFDGTVAWQIQPGSPPSLSQGDEFKSKQRDADMYYPGHELDYFKTMEVVEVTQFEGHVCYHLKGRNNWGKTNEHFYDTTTGLLIGYRFNSAWRGGSGEEIEVFSDYRSFDGWRMPTRSLNKSADGEQIQTLTGVSFDDVADSVFALPEAVKSLLAGKAGAH
jgi:hypothetical protein